jgi:hypothetical protein
MGWLASIVIALLSGVFALFGGGTVASLAVDWYNISSFEGGSGYFVIGMALLGLLAGSVIGLVVSRVVAARPQPSFLKGLGASCGAIALVLALIAGGSRLLADVPPEIDGETLFLQVELRWPQDGLPAPGSLPGVGYLRLGASSGSVVRKQEDGPLFTEDAVLVDGRWTVPGFVWIFTGRGQRLLQAGVGEKDLGGFLVPLPAHPGSAEQQWSDWLPHAASGQPPLPDQLTYRFRVARTSEPLRTARVGGFEIQTIVRNVGTSSDAEGFSASSTFRILHRGQPLDGGGDAGAVAIVGGERTALLVERRKEDQPEGCAFITDGAERPGIAPIGPCTLPMELRPLTSDQAVFVDARDTRHPAGWVDWHTLKRPGLFLLDNHVVDTRSLTFRTFTRTLEPYPASMPPLAVSPDERSFAWFAHDGSEDKPVLGVTTIADSRSYTVPIDRGRMRFNEYYKLDPAWVAHHFEWRRGPDGADVLTARETFGPLPYRGDLTLAKPGEYMSYTVRPGGQKLRSAIVGLLVSEMKGERLPDRLDGYEQRVQVDGKQLLVTVIETSNYVAVSMDYGQSDAEFMKRVAATLDAALATGKYDGAFDAPAPAG